MYKICVLLSAASKGLLRQCEGANVSAERLGLQTAHNQQPYRELLPCSSLQSENNLPSSSGTSNKSS